MIALVLQYHAGDREMADELVHFIADLEPERREDVRLRLVARWDCAHLHPDTLAYVGQKFDLSWAHTTTPWSGWPAGPNGMAKDILTTAPKWLEANGWKDCNGLLLIEPDCVPLQRDWLTQIMLEWEVAQQCDAWVMGSFRDSGGPHGHINGNAMYCVEFGAHAHLLRCGPDYAWDCYHSGFTRKHWHRSGLFLNKFQSKDATEEALRTPEIGEATPTMVHGFRDGSALAIAQKWCLTGEPA